MYELCEDALWRPSALIQQVLIKFEFIIIISDLTFTLLFDSPVAAALLENGILN